MNEIITKEKAFKDLVHIIRGQQVMLDSDLAKLYGYTVKRLNEQVKRNLNKFPDDFMFQLYTDEYISLWSQNATANISTKSRSNPYAFTEQGIYMLATVLNGELAVQQSIYIMRSFKEMRHYLVENQSLLNNTDLLKLSSHVVDQEKRITNIETHMATKNDFDKIMENFIDENSIKDITILNGQKFEAIEAYTKIHKQALYTIFIIDDYININTLSFLKCKKKTVHVTIFSDNKGIRDGKLRQNEIRSFNDEYPTLEVKKNHGICHDRYIIIDYDTDNEMVYHCGASSKDAGDKVCSINQIENNEIFHTLIKRLIEN